MNWLAKISKMFKDVEEGFKKIEEQEMARKETELEILKRKNREANKKAKLERELKREREKYYRNRGGGLF